jgi:hypothetical protein
MKILLLTLVEILMITLILVKILMITLILVSILLLTHDISRYPLSGTGGAVLIPASAVVLGKSPGPPVSPPLSGVCTLSPSINA